MQCLGYQNGKASYRSLTNSMVTSLVQNRLQNLSGSKTHWERTTPIRPKPLPICVSVYVIASKILCLHLTEITWTDLMTTLSPHFEPRWEFDGPSQFCHILWIYMRMDPDLSMNNSAVVEINIVLPHKVSNIDGKQDGCSVYVGRIPHIYS